MDGGFTSPIPSYAGSWPFGALATPRERDHCLWRIPDSTSASEMVWNASPTRRYHGTPIVRIEMIGAFQVLSIACFGLARVPEAGGAGRIALSHCGTS